MPRAEHFGDLITADHKVLSAESASRNNHRYAVVVGGTRLGNTVDTILPCRTKTFSGDSEEPHEVPGADEEPKSHWHWQFLGIWEVLRGIILESLYVNTAQIRNNGTAERVVRRVKEGTSAVLLQSGLGNELWADSMECYCHLRNIQDLFLMGKHLTTGGSESHLTDRWYRLEQWSNIILFLRKTNLDCINLVQKACQVYFLCYASYAVRIWKGDIMVADIEELEEMDASELTAWRRSMQRKC